MVFPPATELFAPIYRPDYCLPTYLVEARLLKELPDIDKLRDWVSWPWDRDMLKRCLHKFLKDRKNVDVGHVISAVLGLESGPFLKNGYILPRVSRDEKAVMTLQYRHLEAIQGKGEPIEAWVWKAYTSWWVAAFLDYKAYVTRRVSD